jgi:hypothetical protein
MRARSFFLAATTVLLVTVAWRSGVEWALAEGGGRADIDTSLLRAVRYELVDRNGEAVGTWSIEEGGPVLRMVGAAGQQVRLAAPSNGAAIELRASDQPSPSFGIVLALDPDVFALIAQDSTAENPVMLGYAREGPVLNLLSPSGEVRLTIPSDASKEPRWGLAIRRLPSSQAASLLLEHDGSAGAQVRTGSGVTTAILASPAARHPGVVVSETPFPTPETVRAAWPR